MERVTGIGRAGRGHSGAVAESTDREVLEAILTSCQYVHVKLTRSSNSSETMAKRKKTKLTAEFWRRDAEQRANAERILAILRREREEKRASA